MLHSTKSTHFRKYIIFFIIGAMCFAAGWNGFAGRISPPGHSLENTEMNYGEERWQHTPLSKSNTNNERLYFNSVDTDTIFWARIQLFDGQQEAPVITALPQHPQSFSRGIRPCTFPRSTKHVYTSLACSQHFSKIGWRVEFCYVVLQAQRKPHWVSSSFAWIISPYLFLTKLASFSWEA